MAQHTSIDLDIVTTNKNLNFKKEGIDVAFRIGDDKISDWVARPLFTANFIVCAAPSLLRWFQRPTCLAELSEMPLLLSRRNPTGLFKNANEEMADTNSLPAP